MSKNIIVWEKTNDYYNREVVTCDVWSRKCRGGKIYLMDNERFTYTFSVGVNSDNSFTGCFGPTTIIETLQEAMDYLDKFIKVHLVPDRDYCHKKMKELQLTIEKI